MDYYITDNGKYVTVAKFAPDASGTPQDVYTIMGGSCDCPSPQRPCKHQRLVNQWRKHIEKNPYEFGYYFDDEDGKFHELPF